MKNKKTIIGAVVLTAAIITTGFIGSVSAYQGNPTVQGPSYTPERHELMEAAFESGDYNSWKELMNGKGRIMEVVNEDNFAKFAEAHELAINGDIEGSRAIRAELGLGQGSRSHGGEGKRGQGRGMNSENRGQNTGGRFIDADGDGSCDNL